MSKAKKFSKNWKSSKKPTKQRKYRVNAPLHLRSKIMSAHLSKELRKKIGKRSAEIRKGDKVKIERGSNKGKIGKIDEVDRKDLKVYIEKIELTKKDGSKARIPIDPSNLTLLELNTEDKRRMKTKEKK